MTTSFQNDRPIKDPDDDQLGYDRPAAHIAQTIMSLPPDEGFVFGLEGDWGTGKSSFINLVIKHLCQLPEPPETVRFSPWLVSSRMAMLRELFKTIEVAALNIPLKPDDVDERGFSQTGAGIGPKRQADKRRLSEALQTFGNGMTRVGDFADLAEAVGLAGAGIFGKGLKALGNFFSGAGEPTIEKSKEGLDRELRNLTRPIVVFIDDLDRLEAQEALEIVRLVRAVMDFPNIIYVLCYSRKILAQNLSNALSIDDGERYIDKIVQVTFSVPKPEDFDLRRLFKRNVEKMFPEQFAISASNSGNPILDRLNQIIDSEGGRSLKTPRDVARVTNATQLYTKPVADKIDLADMVWLQLVRVRNQRLYEWIEEYLNNAAVITYGARLSDFGRKEMFDRLFSLIETEGSDPESVLQLLEEVLPGIEDNIIERDGKKRWEIFKDISKASVADYVQGKRLGSPQHFRYYFALTKPSSALEDQDFQQFLQNAETDVQAAKSYLTSLASSARPQGGSWSEAILDRLVNMGIDKVSLTCVPGVLLSLGDAMDQMALTAGRGEWGEYWVWSTAKSILRKGMKRLTPEQRMSFALELFGNGSALGWLTSLLRDETFAHGLAGDRAKSEEDRLLTPEEFAQVIPSMRARFRRLNAQDIRNIPHFINVLYAWTQLGGEASGEFDVWKNALAAADEGFLAILEGLRTWSATNGKVYYPLRRENLINFFAVGDADDRLQAISKNEDLILAQRAKQLIAARMLARED